MKKKTSKNNIYLQKIVFFFVKIIRLIVSVFRTHIALYFWAIAVLLVIVILMGDFFSTSGLILVLMVLFRFLSPRLERWLKTIEEITSRNNQAHK
jgi:hypothetical protein